MWARSSWKPFAARVEENLLGCHVVAVEKSGEDTGLLVDTLLSPELLAFGEIRDRVVSISTGRATSAAASVAQLEVRQGIGVRPRLSQQLGQR